MDVERARRTDGGGRRVVAVTCEVYGLPVLQRLARAHFHSEDVGFRCARG